MKRVLITVLRTYQRFISPLMAPHCRFHPTCSSYAIEAIASHGALHGSWLALRRLLRCHPFHPGGYDPVPETGHGHHCNHRDSQNTQASHQ